MTVEEAKKAILDIWDAGLDGRKFMMDLGAERVAVACNGCGPASWPQEWRNALGSWLRTFKSAFDVHDCDFTYRNDGLQPKFNEANDRLEVNCLKLADLKYAWWNPCRYIARRKGRLAAWACRTFGWKSWLDAYYKSQNNTTKKENT